MRRHEPTDPTAALTRLAAQVDRLDRQLADCLHDAVQLRADVDAHSRTLTDLADLVRRLHTTDVNPAVEVEVDPLPDWLTVTDPDLAVDWLQTLTMWTATVWCRYRPLPGCWPWHPPVVAELLVCQHVWVGATSPGMPVDLLATWHDRWRPGVARRIDQHLAACERAHGRHVTTGGVQWVYDPTVVDEYAVWWATRHATDPSTPPPGLTRATDS